MTLLLNRRTMETVLDWPSVIAAVERGFIEFAAGHVTQPVRTVLRGATMPGAYVLMPCSIEGTSLLGAKIATIYPSNRLRGLPTIAALYALTDFDTGQMLAIMDAGYMTAIRTAGASIVATMRLARKDAKSLGLSGPARRRSSTRAVSRPRCPNSASRYWARRQIRRADSLSGSTPRRSGLNPPPPPARLLNAMSS
jgi:ornithine cyclodeaminase/alanine dehydrogenase-like protein (mu-crystallin family)